MHKVLYLCVRPGYLSKQGLRKDSEAATDWSILVAYLDIFHKLLPNLSLNFLPNVNNFQCIISLNI